MKILNILPSMRQAGGVEIGVLDWVRYDPETFYVASSGGALTHDIHHHIALPLHTKNPVVIWGNATRLKHIIQDYKIDIVHARSRAPAWSTYKAAKDAGIPFITTYHGLYNSNNFIKNFYNSIMARGDRVIAISRWVEDHIRTTYPKARIASIYEGIDTSQFQPYTDLSFRRTLGVRDNQKLIVLVGRLTRWKGQHVLLKAAQQLDDSYVIALVGSTQNQTYRNELQKLADQSACRICFIDQYKPIQAVYAGANVVVSCSTDPEAFGRTIAEALCMERPYIGTNHGGSVELTDSGRLGLLIPPHDAHTLAEALKNSEQINPSGAHDYIQKNYDAQRMMNETIELYRTLIR